MKKKRRIISSLFSLGILSFIVLIYFIFLKTNNEMIITLDASDVPIESDVEINLIMSNEVINIVTFDRDELKKGTIEQDLKPFDINGDGNIVLQVKIGGEQYEGIVIPYVTNRVQFYYVHLKMESEDGEFLLIGEYSYTLDKSGEINDKLEKVDINKEN